MDILLRNCSESLHRWPSLRCNWVSIMEEETEVATTTVLWQMWGNQASKRFKRTLSARSEPISCGIWLKHATSARWMLKSKSKSCPSVAISLTIFDAHTDIGFIVKVKFIFLMEWSCMCPSNSVEYLLSLEWFTKYCCDVESNNVIIFVETMETNNS